ncbi:hypothetical protein LCGC14_1236060 [marine sediment metagenome]|uniref:Uncharacterized protein n=1 Tax=marine sediment metagenome TaxID=412755 RepID=A0A0F9LUB7_9ZZZZ
MSKENKNILDTKVGKFSILDAVIVGSSKLGTEAVLSKVPMIGNGTFKSGAVKGIGAIVMSLTKQKQLVLSATGIGIDAVEDFILAGSKWLEMRSGNSGNENNSSGQSEVSFLSL